MTSIFYALLAILSWSTAATAFKLALSQINPPLLVFFSSFFSSVVLLVILILYRRKKAFKGLTFKTILNYAKIGLINPFIYYLVLFYAYSLTLAQEALILNYTWGIFLVIFASLLLKQRLKILSLLSLLISFFGVIILTTKGNLLHFSISLGIGNLLALGSAVIWALYWILNLKNPEDPVLSLFFQFLAGSIFSFIVCLISSNNLKLSGSSIIYPIYIGIFEMSVPFVFWFLALKSASETAKVANLIYLSPFLSLLFISSILKEPIHYSSIVALIFIIVGIIFQQSQKEQGIRHRNV